MSDHRIGRTAGVAVAALGLLATGLGPATAAPAAATTPARSAQQQAGPLVPLVTGDLVRLGSAAGKPTAAIYPRDRSGAAGSFRTQVLNGDLYAIPATARAYLGRGLDLALFDVTQLAKAGFTRGDVRLPVRLTWKAGAAHRPVPGVTVTRTQGDSATGYLTPASARQFGAALAAQFRADAAAGGPTGTGLFAGLTGLRWDGATATPPAQPQFPMFTLRLKVIDAAGEPAAFAGVLPMNVDDQRRYNGFPVVENGETRISVPAGNYSFLVETFDQVGDRFVDRVVTVTDYRVTKAQTLTVDMRAAAGRQSVSTPRPATLDGNGFEWLRTDVVGAVNGTAFLDPADIDLFLAPSQPAQVGRLAFSPLFHLTGPGGADADYTYDLRFGPFGQIPANGGYVAQPASLATLDTGYHTDGGPLGPGDSLKFSMAPDSPFGAGVAGGLDSPRRRTEYLTGGDLQWGGGYDGLVLFEDSPDGDFSAAIGQSFSDSLHRYPTGTTTQVEWAAAPKHPSLFVDTADNPNFLFFAPVCRQGDLLVLETQPVADSTAGHRGFLDFSIGTPSVGAVEATETSQLFRGSTRLGSIDASLLEVPVGAAAADYRLVYDQSRSAPWIGTSTASHTEWTFNSGRAAASDLPAGWLCEFDPSQPTVALPLLRADYAAPVDLGNRAAGGPQHLGLTVETTQAAPASAVTSVALDVSFDGGRTFTPATVTGSGGRYDAAFTAPATGAVTTRLRATDAAGNRIDQTVTSLYALGGTA